MQRTAATEGNHGVVGNVFAALDSMDTTGVCHVLIDHLADTESCSVRPHSQRLTNHAPHSAGGVVRGQTQGTAGKVVGIQAAKQQVGVGNGRFQTTTVIASRTWFGCGAVRADANLVHAVDASDRAAACTDLNHFHHWNGNWHATPLLEAVGSRHFKGFGGLRHLVFDQADFCCRAAHIKRHH
ncbi:hypothetical protein D3C84_653440 [compost metagenome]